MQHIIRIFGAAASIVILTTAGPEPLIAGELYDPDAAWPLCGRIAEAPPPGWDENQGCPADRWGSAAFTDWPLSDTFGPRQKESEGDRYDYHRGIDIPTPLGTPIFAITGGEVTTSEDDTVQVRHVRPGATDCGDGGGCYSSRYIHLQSRSVAENDVVVRGQLLGHSGASVSGFAHLHFEIRDAPAFDPFSGWQRDAIHPLAVLAYADDGASQMDVRVAAVDLTSPAAPKAIVELRHAGTGELDFKRLDLQVFSFDENGALTEIVQPGASADPNGYHVHPPWLDLHGRNFEYSHKDSSTFPWSSFADCPYAADHPPTYDPNIHCDRAQAGVPSVGEFNGLLVAPALYNAGSASWDLDVVFEQLVGTGSADDLCLIATATDARGSMNSAQWGCPIFFDGFETGDPSNWSSVF